MKLRGVWNISSNQKFGTLQGWEFHSCFVTHFALVLCSNSNIKAPKKPSTPVLIWRLNIQIHFVWMRRQPKALQFLRAKSAANISGIRTNNKNKYYEGFFGKTDKICERLDVVV